MVLVQVPAALTVGTCCVMAADAKATHLAERRARRVCPSPPASLPTPPAADAPPPALTMPSTLAGAPGAGLHSRGVAMAQAAASGHKLIEGIVVEGVSLEASQGPVTQVVQFGEVHTEVSHMQEH